jgi:hypothetical protein
VNEAASHERAGEAIFAAVQSPVPLLSCFEGFWGSRTKFNSSLAELNRTMHVDLLRGEYAKKERSKFTASLAVGFAADCDGTMAGSIVCRFPEIPGDDQPLFILFFLSSIAATYASIEAFLSMIWRE